MSGRKTGSVPFWVGERYSRFVAYPRQLLNDDEDVVLDRHPHWSFMLGSATMLALSVVFTIVLAILVFPWSWLGLVVIGFALLGSLANYIRWRCIQFVVTSDRIIVRSGVLSKRGLEIPLDRVMNISYKQQLWERILGTGDLVVESAGESGHQLFTDVAGPMEVQNLIYRQVDAYASHNEGGLRASSSPNNGMSIPEQIEKLDELRQRGILTQVEFDDKKQDLLDRL
jgi:membrane protein YdbS with pleckstrin-like domain